MVQEVAPKRPREFDPGVDAKLDAIVMKTLEKDPGKRHQTAGELASALDEWLRETEGKGAEAKASRGGCGKAAAIAAVMAGLAVAAGWAAT
jgi:hypothetical protein